ncbi:MAG TPA: phosphoribosyltransferase [Ktedonobacteraceae bacterium]
MKGQQFRDRVEAGQLLAAMLTAYAHRPDVLVLALPRGGVPVAFEVARALQAPLDVMIVRKLGVPGQEELAMGAVASGGVCVLNESVAQMLHIPKEVFNRIAAQKRREVEQRERLYRGDRPASGIHGRIIILIDDGVATGATMRAAVAAVRQGQPARIIIATPVAEATMCEALKPLVDELVCFSRPEVFFAVGLWYRHFTQTTDEEVRNLLAQAARERQLASEE